MRLKIILLLVWVLTYADLIGQSKKTNVLSYYAVTNSIDGQPLINTTNVIRFYPVYAFRKTTTRVNVTIYYGGEVYRREAYPIGDSLYWEAKLPDFELGESIQRYEVEAKVKLEQLDDFRKTLNQFEVEYAAMLSSIRKLRYNINTIILPEINQHRTNFKGLNDALLTETSNFVSAYQAFKVPKETLDEVRTEFIKQINSEIDETLEPIQQILVEGASIEKTLDTINEVEIRQLTLDLIRELEANKKSLLEYADTLFTLIESNAGLKNDVAFNNLNKKMQQFQSKLEICNNCLNETSGILNKFNSKELDLDSTLINLASKKAQLLDTVKATLLTDLIDPKFTGISIQKSDIILSKDLQFAQILYRNYKLANRDLPALDPAEKLGIFRIRYVPFPVLKNSLAGPVREGFPVIFEAGLTFGNRKVVTNEIFDPTFSVNKLGLAIAFTTELFAEDADVLALALTYDFNSYTSIGAGLNFGELAGNRPDPYFSLGINARAFAALLSGVKNAISGGE